MAAHVAIPDDGITHFTNLGLKHNPNLRLLVQASWFPYDVPDPDKRIRDNAKRDDAQIADLQAAVDDWRKKLEAQVDDLNRQHGKRAVFIVPVGDAVVKLRALVVDGKYPGMSKQSELFRDPIGHGGAAHPVARLVLQLRRDLSHQPRWFEPDIEGLGREPATRSCKKSPGKPSRNYSVLRDCRATLRQPLPAEPLQAPLPRRQRPPSAGGALQAASAGAEGARHRADVLRQGRGPECRDARQIRRPDHLRQHDAHLAGAGASAARLCRQRQRASFRCTARRIAF